MVGSVSLTPSDAGLDVVRSEMRARRAELRKIVSRLGEEQLDELVRCMAAFSKAAGEFGEGAWALGWWD